MIKGPYQLTQINSSGKIAYDCHQNWESPDSMDIYLNSMELTVRHLQHISISLQYISVNHYTETQCTRLVKYLGP